MRYRSERSCYDLAMIYADQRWIGDHDIGRFARAVLANLNFHPVRLASHPAAPLDAWHLAPALSELDLFFSPGYDTPLYTLAPFVFTICDLCHIDCPDISTLPIRIYYATIMKRACHRAASILTIFDRLRLYLGYEIVVPYKLRTGTFGRGLRDWSQIASQLAITAVALAAVAP